MRVTLLPSSISNRSGKRSADVNYYGSAWQDDFLLRDPKSLPRYGHLARKALMHYAGDRYNPNVDGISTELTVREIIYELVSYKVLYKTETYDWDWIDHCMRRTIGQCLKLNLPYDQSRIDAGFMDGCRAKQLIDWQHSH